MNEETPVERFLGRVEPAHGPFGLLGLVPADYDPEMIREALRRRLGQLGRHRQSASTEADEIRLALHVAAAQLSDPAVRRMILSQQGIAVGGVRGAAPSRGGSAARSVPVSGVVRGGVGGAGAVERATPDVLLDFEDVVLRVVAHSGGWNEFAKRRLGGLAHAYGLDMEQLRRVLASVATRGPRARLGDVDARRFEGDGDGRAEARGGAVVLSAPPSGSWQRVLAVVTIVLFLLTGVMLAQLVALVFGGPGEPASRTVSIELPESESASESEDGSAGMGGDGVEASTALTISRGVDRDSMRSPGDLLEDVRVAGAGLSGAPGAATKVFERVLEEVGSDWVEIDPVVLQALRVELVGFQVAAIRADRDAAMAVANAITAPVSPVGDGEVLFGRVGVRRAVFSAGLIARLNRDDLTSSIGSRFRSALVRLSHDGSGARRRDFWPGVALGLEGLARGYIARSSDRSSRSALARGWSAWIEMLERVRSEDPEVGDLVLLQTIERALIEGADPSMSQAAHDGVSRLVALMDFASSESGASERLIMWFDDARVPKSALSLVTSRIVFSSLIPGFGPEMMLRPDATEAARASLRDDYALKLGLPVSSEDRAVADLWRARVRDVLGSRAETPDPRSALERAAVIARLNESATQRWAGEDEAAYETARGAWTDQVLEEAMNLAQAAGGRPAEIERMTSPSRHPDGAWARRYLAAMRNAGIRQELLNELGNSERGPLGPVDADVLAEAACYGGPLPLRRSAQNVVERFGEDPFVINGLLEAMPNAARSPDVSEMVEGVTGRSLPSTRDPSWRVRVRSVLLERLVEMVGVGRRALVEGLEEVIRGSYEDRVASSGAAAALVSGSGGQERGSLSRASTADLAGALRADMAAHARRFSEGPWTFTPLHELERRHQARVRLARGSLQEFASRQLGLAEAMAYVVAAERVSQASEVRAVLDELARRRREANHVFLQIEASEEAMLRLWLIRSGEEVTS